MSYRANRAGRRRFDQIRLIYRRIWSNRRQHPRFFRPCMLDTGSRLPASRPQPGPTTTGRQRAFFTSAAIGDHAHNATPPPLSASVAGVLLYLRKTRPIGAFFCILPGSTRGRRGSPASIRARLHRTAAAAAVRRRFAPHQLRHAHAVEMSREGVPLVVIQRQLGHADLGVTSAYLRGIDNTEIIRTVHGRPTPKALVLTGLSYAV
jgi:integrase